MYLVFNVFYFYSGVGQKDSGVGRAHLPPPFATPLPSNTQKVKLTQLSSRILFAFMVGSFDLCAQIYATNFLITYFYVL
jgi:hypothetical protein